jgi:HK97 family phage prohead protease
MSLTRAYATLELKDFLARGRRFTGVASTISTDRMQDVVEPRGMVAKLPAPLLWQHDSAAPVGWVKATRVSDTEIEADFEIASIHEPGPLKDRLDAAWQSITAGLARGLSIGFRQLPGGSERIAGGGVRYTAWELLEVSVVVIAANQDCTITEIKSIDRELRRTASAGRTGGEQQVDVMKRFNAAEKAADWRGMTAILKTREFANASVEEAQRELGLNVKLSDPTYLAMITRLDRQAAKALQRVIKARVGDLEVRLDKAMQRLASFEKRLAASERKTGRE